MFYKPICYIHLLNLTLIIEIVVTIESTTAKINEKSKRIIGNQSKFHIFSAAAAAAATLFIIPRTIQYFPVDSISNMRHPFNIATTPQTISQIITYDKLIGFFTACIIMHICLDI